MWKHANLNRRYRLVWNRVRQCWSVAPEIASGQGKAAAGASEPVQADCILPLRELVVAIGCAFSLPALALDAGALPTGGTVVAGQASLSQSGSTLTVNQSTDRAILEWQSFNIGKDAAVHFNQNSASSVALNRVTGGTRSEIYGSLTANGQVYLVNSAGVLFGNTAQVDVGGIVASTLDITNDDFLAGKNRFVQGSGSGEVINQGSITARDGGTVALIGSSVSNTGQIVANGGNVALAAGQQVTFAAGANGHLQIAVDASEAQMIVNNGGLIQADGGQVILTAQGANALASAVVSNTGTIQARTVAEREGKILLLADFDSGTTQVAGTLDASAPDGGNGGFIETSAAHVKVAQETKVTTKASTGKNGTWLIDPNDFTVAASGGDMTGATVAANLANTNFTIETATMGSAGGNGDIHINDAISWSADTTLTLNAERNINVNAAITATGTSAGLALNYGGTNGNNSTAPASGSDYNVKAPITLSGTNSTLSINGNVYTLIRSMAQPDAIDSAGLGGRYALAQDLDASGTTYTSALVGTSTNAFTGTFAGLGHTISNLTISAGGADTLGLFSYTEAGSSIRDIGLLGANISGRNYVGGLVGRNNNGSIANAYVVGSVSGNSIVGGLIGTNSGVVSNSYAAGSVLGGERIGGLLGEGHGGSITNAYASSSVSGTGSYVGGLVGASYSSDLNQVYTTGSVSGRDRVGGLIGYVDSGEIINTYATGSILGSDAVGGLIGYNGGSVTNAYATGSVSGRFSIGGLVGVNEGLATNVYATGRVSGVAYLGGLLGQHSGFMANAYWDSTSTGQSNALGLNLSGDLSNITSLTNNNRYNPNAYGNFGTWNLVVGTSNVYAASDANGVQWIMIEGQTRPFLASEYSTSVRNAHQLQLMAYNLGATYTLVNDIDASATAGSNASDMWSTAGFVSVGDSSNRFTGQLDGGNHVVTGLTINRSGTSYVGLFGYTGSNSVVRDIGIVGGSVSGYDVVGGLVGYNMGSLTGVYNASSVGGRVIVGGLVGTNAGSISGAYATGGMSGTSSIGGLVGSNEGSISGSYATGSVSSTSSSSGGLVGTNESSGSISYAYASGNVSGNALVGGLAGVNAGSIANAYSTGSVSGSSTLGGLVGYNFGNGSISNSFYATTNVNGSAINQGIYFISNGTGKAWAELTSLTTFTDAGWDIDDAGGTGLVWRIYEGYTTPLLRSFLKSVTVTAQVNQSQTYNGTTTGTANYTTSLVDAVLDGSLGYTIQSKNVGVYTTSDSTLSLSNGLYSSQQGYDISYVATNSTLTIDKASITVSSSDVSKTYDGTSSAAGSAVVTTGTLFGSDSLSGGSFAFTDINAGTGKTVTASGVTVSDGNNGDNYDVTYADNTSSTIDKASITVSTSDVSKTYDGTTSATGSAVLVGGTLFNSDSLSGGSFAFADINAGTGKTVTAGGVTVSDGNNGGNYDVTYADNTGSTIDKASITVSSSDVSKTYDGTTSAAGSAVVVGGTLFNSDSLSGGSFAFTDINAGNGKTVTASGVTVSDGNNGGNYDVTYANNTGSTIDKASITVSSSDVSKTYDGTTSATGSAVLVGGTLFNSDSLSGGSFAFADINAGTGKTVTAGGVTVSDGNNGGNYDVTYADNTSSTIDKASITVSSSDVSKTYDGTTSAAGSAVLVGGTLFNSDSLSGGSFAFADINAGTGKTVTASGVTVSDGNNGDNYDVTYADNTSSTIDKASITVSSSDVSKTYDGSLSAIGSVVLTGGTLFNSDRLSGGTFAFTDANAGTNKTVTTSGVTVSDGNNGGNYAVTYVDNTSSTIDKASITVTANGGSSTYGDTGLLNPGLSAIGLANGESVSVLTGLANSFGIDNTSNAGSHVLTVSGTLNNGNYIVTQTTNGTWVVDPKAITVVATSGSSTYGDTGLLNPGLTVSGLVNGQSASVLTGLSNSFGIDNTSNAGSYTLSVDGTLTNGNYVVTQRNDGNWVVDPKAITVTAVGGRSTYGDTSSLNPGFTASGLVNGQSESVLTGLANSFGINNTSNAGSHVLTVSGTLSNGNYVVTQTTNGTWVVDPKAITVTANGGRSTYGDSASSNPGFTATGMVNGQSESVLTGLSNSFGIDNTSNAGSHVLTVSGTLSNGNYVVTQTIDGTWVVDPKAITVTANGGSSTYGDTGLLNPGLSAIGLANGETVSVLTGLSNSFGIDNTTNVGSYTLSVNGTLTNGNYVVSQTTDGTWVVDRKTLTVRANDDRRSVSSQAYSGGNGVTYQGFVNGEGVSVLNGSLSYGGSAQGASRAGTYALSVSGLSADNYALQYVDGRLLLTAPLTTPGGGDLVRPVRDGLSNLPSGLPLTLASTQPLYLTIMNDPIGMAD